MNVALKKNVNKQLQGLLPPNRVLVAPAEEKNVSSFVDTNILKRTHKQKHR